MKTIFSRVPGDLAGELLDTTLRQYIAHKTQIAYSNKGWQQYCTGYCMAATDTVKTILQTVPDERRAKMITEIKKAAPSIWDNIAQELAA